ncbi:hypothetical protein F5X68DRAFT_259962 [Plectosphaerella plurivora]|uniref:F-box domain-containing protein n=1 Tax=Plectosphaerella plurivora TaxID=936078 RepID=A0A9P8VG63_9PEZI|nr:hypothetical protein F5X68DRAFT_259962 [Plectosphaerella plurivora]
MAPVTKASIAEGRAAYSGGLYKLALEHFTLVANGCSCNSGPNGRRGRCTCKDFAAAARLMGDGESNSVFHEAMHVCSCGVGEKFQKCHEPQHIQALDYRIHVFEKMARRENAQKDAEWLLEIAPRALEGYLRLGKAYRLAKMPEEAYGIWTAGIKVAGKEGHGGSPKLHQLHQARQSLQMRFSRKDPLQELPIELAENVFSCLSVAELVQCFGVCKRWKSYLQRNPRLWSDLHFNTKRMPSASWFRQLRQTTGGAVESLKVTERSSSTGMEQQRWAALIAATLHAKHLTLGIHCPKGIEKVYADPMRQLMWSNLKSLRLKLATQLPAGEYPFPKKMLFQLLEHNSDTLEELSLAAKTMHIILIVRTPRLFPSHHLRSLSLQFEETNSFRPAHTGLGPEQVRVLARHTPLLEQLWFPWLTVRGDDVDSPSDDVGGLWPHLQVLRLQTWRPSSKIDGRELMVPFARLRSFDLHTQNSDTSGDHFLAEYCRYIQDHQDDGAAKELRYPTLERYWAPTMTLLSEMEPCLAQSFSKGALSVFGTQVKMADSSYVDNTRVDHFLEDLQWMAGEASIKTLGLFNINMNGDLCTDWGILGARTKALVEFIESFPNLETVVITVTDVDSNAALLGKVLALQNVKNLVGGPCPGAKMDALRRLAEENKVALSFGAETLRTEWPMDLKQLDKFPLA